MEALFLSSGLEVEDALNNHPSKYCFIEKIWMNYRMDRFGKLHGADNCFMKMRCWNVRVLTKET